MPKNSDKELKRPPVPPEPIIDDVYGGDEGEQALLDIWKEQHNAKVREQQRAWDEWHKANT